MTEILMEPRKEQPILVDNLKTFKFYGAIWEGRRLMLIQVSGGNYGWITANLSFFAIGVFSSYREALKLKSLHRTYMFETLDELTAWLQEKDTNA